ncbi:MAG: hypothetical protein WCG78_00060 [Candidatus Omnitrophota bacterium]
MIHHSPPTHNGDNALFVGNIAQAFVRQCVSSGAITVAKPETSYEKEQIASFRKNIGAARCGGDALMYAVMFDRIIIDEMAIEANMLFASKVAGTGSVTRSQVERAGFVWSDMAETLADHKLGDIVGEDGDEIVLEMDLDKEQGLLERLFGKGIGKLLPVFRESMLNTDDLRQRSLISSMLPELKEWVSFEMSTMFTPPALMRSDIPLFKGEWATDEEVATLMSLIEPLLVRHPSTSPMKHEVVRDLLDLLVRRPEILSAIEDGTGEIPVGYLEPLFYKYVNSDDNIKIFRAAIRTLRVISRSIFAQLRLAVVHDAVMPTTAMVFQGGRETGALQGSLGRNDMVVGVRLLLKEVEYWPKIETINDVLRLRQKPHIDEFRGFVRQWARAVGTGDKRGEEQLRAEIRSASRSLRKVEQCQKIGGIITYISLPLMVLDHLCSPAFSAGLTVAGFGLQVYADKLLGKHRWITVCT